MFIDKYSYTPSNILAIKITLLNGGSRRLSEIHS